MSNSFNISVAPEIAALDTKVDTVDTVVDSIRATDVPALDVKITTLDTVADNIRNIDVPNIQTNIDANETKIDVIDGIVDSIKLQTDLIPLKPRGNFSLFSLLTSDNTLQTVCNISGTGKLIYILAYPNNAGDTIECKLTIDGIPSILLSHTGDVIAQRLIFSDWDSADTIFKISFIPFTDSDINLLNCEFDTSLLFQIRRSAGAGAVVCGKICVTVDT